MSDPVTNVEIEDVLSSIRKLVAQSEKPDASQETLENIGSEADAPDGDDNDRLVLTPALRVLEEDAEATVSNDETAESEAETVEADAPETAEDHDEADKILNEQTEDADLSSEMTTASGPDEPDVDPAPQAPVFHPDEPSAEIVWENGQAHVETRDGTKSDLLTTIAELEAAVGETASEWEPDGSEPEQDAPWTASVDVPDSDTSPPPAMTDEGALRGIVTSMVRDVVEEAPIVLEPVSTSHEDGDEAEADFDAAYEDDPSPVEQAADQASLADESVADAPEFDQDNDDDPDLQSYLNADIDVDPDALRALVSDIVREELQGVLGERITRNVRKLVRREIYRILSTQDME